MSKVKKKAAKKKAAPRRRRAVKKVPLARQRRAEVDPMAMSVHTMAKLLSTVSDARITKEMVRADLGDGAPTNHDGTINLVHYTAWLAHEHAAKG